MNSEAKEIWICENIDCREIYEGKNPPDFCSSCGGEMFENLQDMADEGLTS